MRSLALIVCRVADACALLLRWLLGLGLAALVCAVMVQVIGRFVFSSTPAWAEVFSGMILAWMAFLGAALAIKSDENLTITLLPDQLSGILRQGLIVGIALASGLFAWVLLTAGWSQVVLTSSSNMLGLYISSSWLYLCAPVSGLFMLVFLVDQALQAIVDDPELFQQ